MLCTNGHFNTSSSVPVQFKALKRKGLEYSEYQLTGTAMEP